MARNKMIMFDLETMASDKDAAIIQIAACRFNPDTGKIWDEFNFYVDPVDAAAHRNININTILWWMQQDQDIRNSIYFNKDAKGLHEMLMAFNKYVDQKSPMWCHANFDAPILDSTYRYFKMKPKYSYRQISDLRALTIIAKHIGINPASITSEINNEARHDALSDVIYQARYTMEILNAMKEKVNGSHNCTTGYKCNSTNESN